MKILLISIFIYAVCIGLSAQSVPDNEFIWTKTLAQISEKEDEEIFVKVEQTPLITQYNQKQFKAILQKSIDELELSNNSNGLMKLKVNFIKNHPLKLVKIGLRDMTLTELQKEKLVETFNSIREMTLGKQRNIFVNCQGILYLIISNGQLTKMKNMNFNFQLQ